MSEANPAAHGVLSSVGRPGAGPPPRNTQATAVALPAPLPEQLEEQLEVQLQQEPITHPDAQPRAQRWARRAMAGERWIARVLRTGAVMSGGMFVASLALELLPRGESVHVAIDLLRKGAASMLLVTPVARLAMAGTLLGLRGEWRYTAIAAGVLCLLALAVGAGFQA
ncbi:MULTISPECIES: DUF1634 domain-containing protein [Corallococcus]|uniref:DUF1634 domain-containing protein n=1 Tax=Corallococcus TaxID=83461 RepID=UPI001F2FDBD6|nr:MULTISPECIES: DUF1634 domain-containing protein [Corallococcus]